MNIAVYCAATLPSNEKFVAAAKELGKWIGENKHTLIYGGGDDGLMGIVARACKEAGGKAIGVVPADISFISNRDHSFIDELITTADMSSRKKKMLDLSDICIALPGGIGTIDEMSEAICLTKLGVYNKKCIFFNSDNFYNPLLEMLKNMDDEELLKLDSLDFLLFSHNVEEINDFLK